jgi:hypothetical protein
MDTTSTATTRLYLVEQGNIALMRYARGTCHVYTQVCLKNLGRIRKETIIYVKFPSHRLPGLRRKRREDAAWRTRTYAAALPVRSYRA